VCLGIGLFPLTKGKNYLGVTYHFGKEDGNKNGGQGKGAV
jgi:hypothetical protein